MAPEAMGLTLNDMGLSATEAGPSLEVGRLAGALRERLDTGLGQVKEAMGGAVKAGEWIGAGTSRLTHALGNLVHHLPPDISPLILPILMDPKIGLGVGLLDDALMFILPFVANIVRATQGWMTKG